MHILTGTRFGAIEFTDADIVVLEGGLIGFPHLQSFLLVSTREDSPFRWLQSIDQPELAFLLADPASYVTGYAPELTDAEAARLGLEECTPVALWTTARIPPGKPEELTLNLAGPIVINLETRIGRQIVVENEAYPTRFAVFQTPASPVAA